MNKKQRLTQWILDNDNKYPTKFAWRDALVKFVVKDLNYIEAAFTAPCWCGKDRPCDGSDHDLRLYCMLVDLKTRISANRTLTWLSIAAALSGWLMWFIASL